MLVNTIDKKLEVGIWWVVNWKWGVDSLPTVNEAPAVVYATLQSLSWERYKWEDLGTTWGQSSCEMRQGHLWLFHQNFWPSVLPIQKYSQQLWSSKVALYPFSAFFSYFWWLPYGTILYGSLDQADCPRSTSVKTLYEYQWLGTDLFYGFDEDF